MSLSISEVDGPDNSVPVGWTFINFIDGIGDWDGSVVYTLITNKIEIKDLLLCYNEGFDEWMSGNFYYTFELRSVKMFGIIADHMFYASTRKIKKYEIKIVSLLMCKRPCDNCVLDNLDSLNRK